MKSSEEMTQDVLRRVDEYQAEKKARHAKTVKAVTVTVPAFVTAVLLVMVWAGIMVTRRGRTVTVDTVAQSETPTASTTPASSMPSATSGATESPHAAAVANGTEGSADDEGDASTNMLVHSRGTLTWNGKEYYYARDWYLEVDRSTFTADAFLGTVGDFEGEYGANADATDYAIDATDSVYSVKETPDVLLVVRGEGKHTPTDWGMPGSGETVVLADSDWLDPMIRLYGGSTVSSLTPTPVWN